MTSPLFWRSVKAFIDRIYAVYIIKSLVRQRQNIHIATSISVTIFRYAYSRVPKVPHVEPVLTIVLVPSCKIQDGSTAIHVQRLDCADARGTSFGF